MYFCEEDPCKYLLFRHIFVDTANIKPFHIKGKIASVYYQVRYIGEQIAMIQSLQT